MNFSMQRYLCWAALTASFAISTLDAETSPSSFPSTFVPMNRIYHPVSTNHPEAQRAFDRGLTFIFAYNHDLAFHEFERAAKADPNLAMAYWGMAVALGQNINTDVPLENEKLAYDYSQKALKLMTSASPSEQAYIKALVQRYTNNPNKDLVPLRFVYREAMKKVMQEYPEDLDAASLYAESILNLDPWRYWTWDGQPRDGVLEAIGVLESILTRNPEHVGANHFYIHAWEESPTPQRALMSAFRLTELLPEAGHLLHMPCHIFILCGYYDKAIQTNKRAIAADRKYISEAGMDGEYPLHYLSHNLKILVRAYMLSEQYEHAMQATQDLIDFVKPHFTSRHHLSNYMITPMEVNLYFHRWETLLALSPPPEQYAFPRAYWHFSRALAYANLGNLEAYQNERHQVQAFKQKIDLKEEVANNPARQIIELGELLLDAAEAHLRKNLPVAIASLKKAVDLQDRFHYDEPPPWYMPLRISLGKALIEEKRYSEAEDVFRKGLGELQRNGRLLLGLFLSLKAQEREWDAFWVGREAQGALQHAFQSLTLDNL